MIKLFKRDVKDVELNSICDGKMIAIEDVPDNMFANKLLGDGVAFEFEGDCIYSPCKAEVIMVSKTKHAFGLKLANGAELMIHVGLDTVSLKGKGLTTLVHTGSKIKKGTPLLLIDREFMDSNNMALTTPVVVTNSAEYELVKEKPGDYSLADSVLKIVRK